MLTHIRCVVRGVPAMGFAMSLERRQEEIERGEVETIPVEVVLARMRAIRP